MIVGRTANASVCSGLAGSPMPPKTSEEPSTECASSDVITVPAFRSTICPQVNLITTMAKKTCNPSPQATVRQRIARRSVDRAYATPNKTTTPIRPVNRAK